MDRRTWRMVRFGVLLVTIVIGLIASQLRDKADRSLPEAQPPAASSRESAPSVDAPRAKFVIRDATIKDLEGDVAYKGDIDLSETLARIDAGKRLRFRNDGVTFENRERRLPRKTAGHYREWVHPTPGLAGPGPQRVVTGAEGEAFYTPDHYRTFQQLR